ncbi:MAG TPA: T9SS type A sorting domain-containing protein [Paludibacteraceae bacterium]|nr:T9SS type A sorting domain-containing protein [Paludibacteraceae bacterium]
MKTLNTALAILIWIVLMPLDNYSQPNLMNRGHANDDIYVIYDGGTYNYLLYLTSNGEVISKRSDNVLYVITGEPIPGKLFGHTSAYFGVSEDYGQHFNMLPPLPYYYITIFGLLGGEVAGNYTIYGEDISVYPYPMGVLYKTTDNFATYTLVADTLNELTYCEGGSVAGELYQIPILNGHASLCHSLDYGATFDTLAIDTAIINENLGIEVKKLSHGAAQGELYLVTIEEIAASKYKYIIYHSADYGVSWQMKYFFEDYSNKLSFTAGRGACKFYIAIVTTTPGSTYNTLTILYSDDCAEAFAPYYHLLSPDVGINENDVLPSVLSVSPNPASEIATITYKLRKPGNVQLEIFSPEGRKVKVINEGYKARGKNSCQLISSNLSPGIYNIVLKMEREVLTSTRFVVIR